MGGGKSWSDETEESREKGTEGTDSYLSGQTNYAEIML